MSSERKAKFKGDGCQKNCPNCGGIHFGTRFDNCPFVKAACVVCGDDTIYACSDCRIDTGQSVHVCADPRCQQEHEKLHPNAKLQDLSPEVKR